MTELHPIQLHEISISRLSIEVPNPKIAQAFEGEIEFSLQRGTSKFERDDPHIAVGIRASASPKTDGNTTPEFSIEIELSGQFSVDYGKFSFDDLNRWALVNAPFLLLPYVREQVYGLALRAGIKGLILPLMVQPSRRVDNANKS